MMLESLLEALGQTPLATYVAEDPIAFPWIETAHVISLVIVFGSIFLVDMRLMGLASRDYSISGLTRTILPITWIAFIGAVFTGSLMFMSNPHGYFGNTMFRVKMLLLLAAGVNMMVFHLVIQRNAKRDGAIAISGATRLAGLISVLLWIGIIACGRWIGFTMAPF